MTPRWCDCSPARRCAAGDALTKYYSPNRGKIIAAQLSVATAIPFTIALFKVRQARAQPMPRVSAQAHAST